MTEFSALSKFKVTDENTAKYTFYDLPGEPYLICKPAIKQNKKFWSAVISDPLMQKIASGRVIKESDGEQAINNAISIYANHVITDWGDMQDLTGDENTPATKENKVNFLAALNENAEWLWDQFAQWAQNPRNFLAVDAEEKAKN